MTNDRTATHLEMILAALGDVAGKQIIDLGCDESALGRELAQRGGAVTGIDPLMPAQDWQPLGSGRYRILQTGAEHLPFDDRSIDAALFIFSLHHLPMTLLPAALVEVRRVLKSDGMLYVAEPLAEGDFNSVVSLFHDEGPVRASAQRILADTATPLFPAHDAQGYLTRRQFRDFDAFATMMTANMRFNDYTAEAVVAPPVRAQFAAVAQRNGGVFDQPVKVDIFR